MDKPSKTAKRRDRRSFTPEFKAEVVRLCKAGDRSIERVAKDLDLTETALREWVQRADIDAGNGPAGAAATRIRNKTLRIHSDRGGIYGEHEYVQRLRTLGIERSMSRASNPWDNAAMESFFSTLQFELLSRKRFETLEDARAAITEWIDGFYNSQRRHTTIGGTSPIKYELSWQMRQSRT